MIDTKNLACLLILELCSVCYAQRFTACSRVGNRIPSAGTVAKFIIKCSLFILSLNRDSSARNCC